jgi:hypothetical protein
MQKQPFFAEPNRARRPSKLGAWLERTKREETGALAPEQRLAIALELSDMCLLLRRACSRKA